RALYAYARLVDILGDELEGGVEARLAALDELEREVDAVYRGEATWPVVVELQPTIREFDLSRGPFLRLIEANRDDQRVSQYETWDDLKHYCIHSANPCGRLVLGVLRRADDSETVALSDDVCTGLQLVNFLQDVPRDLALGRVYLPAEDRRRFVVTELERPNEPLRRLLEFEAVRARALLSSGDPLGRRLAAGRDARLPPSPVGGRRLWTRWSVPTSTSSRAGRSRPAHASPAQRSGRSSRDDRGRLRGGRAADAAARPQLRLRDHAVAAAQATGDRRRLCL